MMACVPVRSRRSTENGRAMANGKKERGEEGEASLATPPQNHDFL